MKNILTLINLTLISSLSIGQIEILMDGQALPEIIIEDDLPNDPNNYQQTEFQIDMYNIGTDTAKFKHGRLDILHSGWNYYVADCEIAWLLTSENEHWIQPIFVKIPPGDSCEFVINYTQENNNCSIQRFYFYDENEQAFDSLTINLSAVGHECYLNIDETLKEAHVYFDANQNQIIVQGLKVSDAVMNLYNINGQLIGQYQLNSAYEKIPVNSGFKGVLLYDIQSSEAMPVRDKIFVH